MGCSKQTRESSSGTFCYFIRDTSHSNHYMSTVDTHAVTRAIWKRGRPGPAPVPREDAPEVVVQDDGITRHVPLSDKLITDEQIRAYVSDQLPTRRGTRRRGVVSASTTPVNKATPDGYDARFLVMDSSSGLRPVRLSTTSCSARVHSIRANTSLGH